jgi:hypothetical protein
VTVLPALRRARAERTGASIALRAAPNCPRHRVNAAPTYAARLPSTVTTELLGIAAPSRRHLRSAKSP